MSNQLIKDINKVIKFLSFLDNRKMLINVYIKDDKEGIVKFMPDLYTKRISEDLPVRFMPRSQKFKSSADLNVIFNSYKSDFDKIEVVKDKILSDKTAELNFYYTSEDSLDHVIYRIFRPWTKSRKDSKQIKRK